MGVQATVGVSSDQKEQQVQRASCWTRLACLQNCQEAGAAVNERAERKYRPTLWGHVACCSGFVVYSEVGGHWKMEDESDRI